MKPVLFLLKPGFEDPAQGPGRFICPGCAAVEGILSLFPEVKERLDIRHVDFPRPRQAIIDLVGEEHQGCPVLVADGKPYTGDAAIAHYLATHFGIPRYH